MELPLPYLPLRDPVSSLTHLLTSLCAVYVTLLLRRLTRGDRTKRLSLTCFGICMILLYAASGLYHAIPLPKTTPVVEVFRRLDHSAIYLLIAGTYTPVFAVLLRGRQRGLLLALVWLLACGGIAAKWLLPFTPIKVSVAIYVALGWLGLLAFPELIRAVGLRAMALGGLGGLCYTAGALCEVAHWPVLVPGLFAWHEVFHLCDMAGTALHVAFMVRYVVPYQPADEPLPLPANV
jgi:hemolysin III